MDYSCCRGDGLSFADQMRGVFAGLNNDYGGLVTVEVRSATYNTRGDSEITWSPPVDYNVIIISVPQTQMFAEQGELIYGDIVSYFPHDAVISDSDKVSVDGEDYIIRDITSVGVGANTNVIYKRVLLAKEDST